MAHAERTRLPGPAGTPIEIFDVVDARRELKVCPSYANPGNKLQKFVDWPTIGEDGSDPNG